MHLCERELQNNLLYSSRRKERLLCASEINHPVQKWGEKTPTQTAFKEKEVEILNSRTIDCPSTLTVTMLVSKYLVD